MTKAGIGKVRKKAVKRTAYETIDKLVAKKGPLKKFGSFLYVENMSLVLCIILPKKKYPYGSSRSVIMAKNDYCLLLFTQGSNFL